MYLLYYISNHYFRVYAFYLRKTSLQDNSMPCYAGSYVTHLVFTSLDCMIFSCLFYLMFYKFHVYSVFKVYNSIQ